MKKHPLDGRHVLVTEEAFLTLIHIAAKTKGQHPVVVWKEPITEQVTFHSPSVYLIPIGQKESRP